MAEINNLADLNKDPNLLMAAVSFAEKEFNAENITHHVSRKVRLEARFQHCLTCSRFEIQRNDH